MAKILLSTGSELAFVCLFGVAVVFSGLVILVGLIYLMNLVCNKLFKEGSAKSTPSAPAPAPTPAPAPSNQIANRGEIVAAVCAAIAEKEGTDISAIRVISFKKLN